MVNDEIAHTHGRCAKLHLVDQLNRELLRGRKPVLEKALAVPACLRCGQHFGGATSLPADALVNVIDKLLDPHRGILQPMNRMPGNTG